MEKSDHRPLLGPSFLLLLLLLSSIVCGGHVCWPMVILVQVSLVIITTFTVTNLSFPTAEFFSQLSFWVMDKWGLIFISKIFLIFMIMAERLLDKALMLFFFFSLFFYLFILFFQFHSNRCNHHLPWSLLLHIVLYNSGCIQEVRQAKFNAIFDSSIIKH